MCVICVVTRKMNRPSNDTLRDMAQTNPDLCGLSYVNHDRKVVTWRGLTLDELLDVNHSIPDFTDIVYHFRIATSGTVNVLNSHPFPLWTSKKEKYAIGEASIAHNGVFGSGTKKYSDTYHLVRMIETLNLTDGGLLLDWLADYSNKIALLTKHGVTCYGTFKKTKDEYNDSEYLVSNEFYKPYYAKHTYHNYKSQTDVCDSCGTALLAGELAVGLCVYCQRHKDSYYSDYSVKPASTTSQDSKIVTLGGSQLAKKDK